MRTCLLCKSTYPDEVNVCPVDGSALDARGSGLDATASIPPPAGALLPFAPVSAGATAPPARTMRPVQDEEKTRRDRPPRRPVPAPAPTSEPVPPPPSRSRSAPMRAQGGRGVTQTSELERHDFSMLLSAEPPTVDIEPPESRIGKVVGSYRLLEIIGRGGMGCVYRAEHVKLGRDVALKLLREDYAQRRDAVTRFFQEARAVNLIRHRNIVDVIDYVELDGGTVFIIMELLAGTSLGRLMRGPLQIGRALGVLAQICDGLSAAHAVGIVHRDLKPDNIIVVRSPEGGDLVKILDFGVAKLVDKYASDPDLTAVGSVIGTPAYMSPEQAGGLAVDGRADVYSLGAIMYELFTREPLFRAESFGEFVRKHLNDDPIPPSQVAGCEDIDPRLEGIIMRCLAKGPDSRFQSALELRASLIALLDDVESHAPAPAGRERRPSQNWGVVEVADEVAQASEPDAPELPPTTTPGFRPPPTPPPSARNAFAPASGSRPSVGPASGSQRAVAPSSGPRPAVAPPSGSRPALAPVSASQPAVAPPSESQRSLTPASEPRPALRPASGSRPPPIPEAGARPAGSATGAQPRQSASLRTVEPARRSKPVERRSAPLRSGSEDATVETDEPGWGLIARAAGPDPGPIAFGTPSPYGPPVPDVPEVMRAAGLESATEPQRRPRSRLGMVVTGLVVLAAAVVGFLIPLLAHDSGEEPLAEEDVPTTVAASPREVEAPPQAPPPSVTPVEPEAAAPEPAAAPSATLDASAELPSAPLPAGENTDDGASKGEAPEASGSAKRDEPAAPSPPSKPIRVRIVSRPIGELHAAGRRGALCETPCALTINPDDGDSSRRRVYVIKRRGYEDETVTIDLDAPPRQLKVELRRRRSSDADKPDRKDRDEPEQSDEEEPDEKEAGDEERPRRDKADEEEKEDRDAKRRKDKAPGDDPDSTFNPFGDP
jgi:eukaryotic-like serine/threonine-protein kinase